ncbi:hypothetical protein KFE25_005956 [Diacronema lutheri]|uniref:Protein-tyrosine sulfotransferase n=1 Tax=Diacronema lutheri TaxID=2081491 RepID=A0A8J5XV17_DIALT|nr:hypothetical protein KFE25_005956 [Diacronema lutheri]
MSDVGLALLVALASVAAAVRTDVEQSVAAVPLTARALPPHGACAGAELYALARRGAPPRPREPLRGRPEFCSDPIARMVSDAWADATARCGAGGAPPQHEWPIIVGGLPGSSTRGYAKLLKSAGVFIGHMERGAGAARLERTPCPRVAARVLEANRSFNAELDFVAGREPDMSRKLLHATDGRFDFRLDALPDARLAEEVARVSCRAYAHLLDAMHRCVREAVGALARSARGDSCAGARTVVPIAHGWKHGASMFLLPVYVAMFGARFFFVHVVRDGRDMAVSIDRATAKRYHHFCGAASRPPPIGGCRGGGGGGGGGGGVVSNPKAQLQAWAVANLGVTELARRHLGARYALVRAEDAVLGSRAAREAALGRLLAQLHLRSDVPLHQLATVFEHRIGFANVRESAIGARNVSGSGAAHAYTGKWRARLSGVCVAELLALPLVCEALHEYGYMHIDRCRLQAAGAAQIAVGIGSHSQSTTT